MAVTEETQDHAAVLADGRATIEALIDLRREAHCSMKSRAQFTALYDDFKKRVAKGHPSESSAETRRGTLQWILGHLEGAIRTLEENRASKEKFYFLGRAYLDREQPSKAAAALKEAYELDRDDLTVSLAYAEAVIRAGDLENAEKIVERLGKKEGKNPDVLYLQGLMQDMAGDIHGAQAKYEAAHDLDPGHQKALFRLAYMLDLRGEESRALELYTQLRKMDPLHMNTLMNLGVIFEDRGDYEKAAECFRSVVDYQPNHPRAKLFLADAESSLNMYYDEDAAKKEAKLRTTLGQPLMEFSFSRRVRESFNKLGVTTVGELAALSEEELMEVPNFGRTSLDEIRDFLATKGLNLAYQEGAALSMPSEGPAEETSVFDTVIEDVDLPARVKKTLEAHEINTIGDLVKQSEADLKALNISASAMEVVKDKLQSMGLHLRPS